MEIVETENGKKRIKKIEYIKTNHIITIKTHGMRNLKDTFDILGYGTYSPLTFSALTLKHKNPSATVVVFSTGNITIMGAPNFWGAMFILQHIREKLNLKILNIKLTNVVVNLNIKMFNDNVKINNLYEWDQSKCVYDEELFPSCTYNVPNTNIKANFFTSGKIVVTGCNTEAVVISTIQHLVDLIHRFTDGEKDLLKNKPKTNV